MGINKSRPDIFGRRKADVDGGVHGRVNEVDQVLDHAIWLGRFRIERSVCRLEKASRQSICLSITKALAPGGLGLTISKGSTIRSWPAVLYSKHFRPRLPTLWSAALGQKVDHHPAFKAEPAASVPVRPVNGGTPPSLAPARWGAAWTTVEVDTMLAMVQKRKRQADIAQALCRTLGAIKVKLAQLRQGPQERARPATRSGAAGTPLRRRPWSRAETEALLAMTAKGWDDVRIADALNRTPVAISVRRSRMNMPGSKADSLRKLL